MPSLTDQEFARFQRFDFEAAGITLSDAKKVMVGSRLAMRLQKCQVNNYGDYFRLLASGQQPEEVQTAVDLLTTNETYFFREPNHFDFLKTQLQELVRYSEPVRVWSAAGSTGPCAARCSSARSISMPRCRRWARLILYSCAMC